VPVPVQVTRHEPQAHTSVRTSVPVLQPPMVTVAGLLVVPAQQLPGGKAANLPSLCL
jgi:hypothetical protein